MNTRRIISLIIIVILFGCNPPEKKVDVFKVYNTFTDTNEPFLALRKEPDTNSEILLQMHDDTKLEVLVFEIPDNSKFSKVRVLKNNQVGFCSNKYIVRIKEEKDMYEHLGKANVIMEALLNDDFKALSKFVHPTKGLKMFGKFDFTQAELYQTSANRLVFSGKVLKDPGYGPEGGYKNVKIRYSKIKYDNVTRLRFNSKVGGFASYKYGGVSGGVSGYGGNLQMHTDSSSVVDFDINLGYDSPPGCDFLRFEFVEYKGDPKLIQIGRNEWTP